MRRSGGVAAEIASDWRSTGRRSGGRRGRWRSRRSEAGVVAGNWNRERIGWSPEIGTERESGGRSRVVKELGQNPGFRVFKVWAGNKLG